MVVVGVLILSAAVIVAVFWMNFCHFFVLIELENINESGVSVSSALFDIFGVFSH